MKKYLIKSLFMALLAVMALVSCSKDSIQTEGLHTCEMKLIGGMVGFGQAPTRAADSNTWADGSTIYLRLSSPMGITTGTAVYKKATDVWTVSYYGSLSEDVMSSCVAVYFEDYVSADNSVITLNENSVIYEDQAGTYIYAGGDLLVTANLKPKTGRLHLKGNTGQVIKVYGVSHYTSYDYNTNLYKSTNTEFKTTVQSDGYTPYLYGFFTEENDPNIKLWIDAKEAYTRFLSKELFKAGESGKLTVPTSSNYVGWSDGLIFSVKNERFKMIAVEGGTFTMGVVGAENDAYYYPHNVTLTGYCLAETELTYRLYGAITSNTSDTSLRPYSISGTHYSNLKPIVDKLSEKTYTVFYIPTEAQWEYAAKGGKKSKGYFYSGSDSFNDVGIDCSYYYSSYVNVKTKLPNELGFYDMSGNAVEITSDKYDAYPTYSQIDPENRTSSYGVLRIGNGKHGVANRLSSDNGWYVAVRPALRWD